MKTLTDKLMALQEFQGKSSRVVPNRAERMAALRAQIPDSFLNAFDRFVAGKKKPVSIVHNGVCSECHLQIAAGTLGSLAFGQGVQQCGNCGRFLYLPEDESVYEAASSPKSKVHSKRETTAPVALRPR
jgi:predicted  nucleic acid-binding Zn-ribbon protein